MNEHELMILFNAKFQVYTDIRFLKFNMEKALKFGIHAIDVFVSKDSTLIYRKTRYLAPIAVAINGQKRNDLLTVSHDLGFIPLLKLSCNDDVRLINLESNRKYKLPRADDFVKSSKDLIREYNIKFNKIEIDNVVVDSVKNELDRLGIKYKEEDNIIELINQKVIISNISTFMLPDKYVKDYIVVCPDVRYLYKMKLQNNQQGNRLVSVGFITRKDNKDIIFHPEDHRVIIENNMIIEA